MPFHNPFVLQDYKLSPEEVKIVWKLLDRTGQEKIDVEALKRGSAPSPML